MVKKRTERPVFEAPQEEETAQFGAQNFLTSLNREKLREAIILKEVLDLPVALR